MKSKSKIKYSLNINATLISEVKKMNGTKLMHFTVCTKAKQKRLLRIGKYVMRVNKLQGYAK